MTHRLRHSRDRVNPSAGRIRKPRHFLLYRVAADGYLEIGRVLHDSMGLAPHFPSDYQSAESNSDGGTQSGAPSANSARISMVEMIPITWSRPSTTGR